MKINKKKAFTMTEMLISFAIVAAVAGLFMMRFRNASPKDNIVNYKKTYFTLAQVIGQMANDFQAFPDSNNVFMIDGERISETEIDFDRMDDDPNTIEDESLELVTNASSNYFCKELVRRINIIGDPATACNEYDAATREGVITLTNGVQILGIGNKRFERPAGADDYTREYIDVDIDTNGVKPPNSSLPSDSRDRFRIRIFFDGKVTTDSSWRAENAIFEAGSRAQNLNLREFPDEE